MAQTPARDFIKTAVVDFRFIDGTVRNHANTAWALVNTGVPVIATISPTHGVPALTAVDNQPEQTWMTAAQTAMTFEALFSLDMLHQKTSADLTTRLLVGDWNISFLHTYGVGNKSEVTLTFAFNGDGYGGTYYIIQDLSVSQYASLLKGSPMHLVVSAQYTVGTTTLDVTTSVNGVVTTDATTDVNHAMIAAPTNTLFDASNAHSPAYFVRMWNTYQSDADVLADLYRAAQRVLPVSSFSAVIPGAIMFDGGGES